MQVRHEQRLAYMGSDELDWNEIKLAFLDPKVWLRYFPHSAIFFPADTNGFYVAPARSSAKTSS